MSFLGRIRHRHQSESPPPSLAFPYYVDARGLRGLADSLGIGLPTVVERKRDSRLSAQAHGVGAEAGREEGQQLEGHIHLNVLVVELQRRVAFPELVDVLGLIPRVQGERILGAAIAKIENMPAEEVSERLSERLEAAYETERIRRIATAKRQELRQVAVQNQLVILRGTFETVDCEDGRTLVRLTHLEPTELVSESAVTPDEEVSPGREELRMPEEVGIEAVLPAADAFTADGRERLNRGAPFYGQLIAHSASFNQSSGVLTCSAYALWGMPRARGLLDQPSEYDFLEGR
jgi:hypothetical protein